MTSPSQTSRFNHPDYIRLTVQVMKFLIVKPYPFPFRISHGPNYSSQDPVLHSSLPVTILKTLLSSSILATRPAHLNLLDIITLIILRERYNLWISSLWSLIFSPFASLIGPNIRIMATWYAQLNLLDLITLKILGQRYKLWCSSLWNLLHFPFASLSGPNTRLRSPFLNMNAVTPQLNGAQNETNGRLGKVRMNNLTLFDKCRVRTQDKGPSVSTAHSQISPGF